MPLHQATQDVIEFFEYEHLREGPIRDMSAMCAGFVDDLVEHFEADGVNDPELTVGFRDFLRAKDCFVRGVVRHEKRKAQAAAENESPDGE